MAVYSLLKLDKNVALLDTGEYAVRVVVDSTPNLFR